MFRRNDGSLEAIDPEKLYHVVCGTYMGQMLGNVEATSFGLLTITPRHADGTPIDLTKLFDNVVRDENGNPVKEWYAISAYLDQMGEEMDGRYADVDGRKVVYKSWNPVSLLRNANKFTYILLAVIVLLVLIIVLIVKGIKRLIRRFRKK